MNKIKPGILVSSQIEIDLKVGDKITINDKPYLDIIGLPKVGF